MDKEERDRIVRLMFILIRAIKTTMQDARDSFSLENPSDAAIIHEFHNYLLASILNTFEANARNS